MFRVGGRVRLIDGVDAYLVSGSSGTVLKSYIHKVDEFLDVRWDNGHETTNGWYAWRFQTVEPMPCLFTLEELTGFEER